jgi:hypothetical protein
VAAAEHGWDFGAAISRRTGAGAGCARGFGGEEFDSRTEEGGGGGEGVREERDQLLRRAEKCEIGGTKVGRRQCSAWLQEKPRKMLEMHDTALKGTCYQHHKRLEITTPSLRHCTREYIL